MQRFVIDLDGEQIEATVYTPAEYEALGGRYSRQRGFATIDAVLCAEGDDLLAAQLVAYDQDAAYARLEALLAEAQERHAAALWDVATEAERDALRRAVVGALALPKPYKPYHLHATPGSWWHDPVLDLFVLYAWPPDLRERALARHTAN